MPKDNKNTEQTTALVKYKRPPIQEAVCEIRFKIANPLNQEALKKFESVWKPLYPLVNVVAERQLKLHLTLDKMDATQHDVGHKLIMRSADGKNLAQLGATFMAVNQLSPYQGWNESFRDQILHRFDEVRSFYAIDTVTQIGLRYINRIDIPQCPLKWNEWIAVALPIPNANEAIGGDLQSFYRHQLADNTIAQINFATAPPSTTEVTSLLLDIDVICAKEVPVSGILDTLEKVHKPHRTLFEGFLLDKTRNLFNI